MNSINFRKCKCGNIQKNQSTASTNSTKPYICQECRFIGKRELKKPGPKPKKTQLKPFKFVRMSDKIPEINYRNYSPRVQKILDHCNQIGCFETKMTKSGFLSFCTKLYNKTNHFNSSKIICYYKCSIGERVSNGEEVFPINENLTIVESFHNF